MPPLRRRSSLLPFLGISIILLILPSGWTRKARLTTVTAFAPIQWVASTLHALPAGVLPSHGDAELQAQVDFFKDQIQKLLNENEILKDKVDQVSKLKQACPEHVFKLLHAGVLLPTDGSPWRKSLTLSLGSKGGVQKGMLVLYNNQLVGRILETSPWTSLVQLVTDPAFHAGAVAVPKTTVTAPAFDKRHVGVYEGTAGQRGQLKWFMSGASIDPEGFVLTTDDPANGVPRGLLLGRVAGIANALGSSPRAEVDPVVDFRALEHVMILVGDMIK
jgi:rod shape-determining protein MreC